MMQTYFVFMSLLFQEACSVSFYPYGSSQHDNHLIANDDSVFPAISITTPFTFFGHRHSFLFVNTNGDLTFRSSLASFTPVPFPHSQNISIIAAYWGDVDTRKGGDIWYSQPSNRRLLQRATVEIRNSFPQLTMFDASWIFIATWHNVAHYSVDKSKRSTFQCVLVTDGRYAFVMLLYQKTEWTPAKVGFDAGDGVHYHTVMESSSPDIFNLPTMSNVNVTGKYIFRVDLETISESTNVDECNSFPCQHNGSCVSLIDFYQCHCRDGYSGLNCEIEIDECISNPCLHGASCRNLENGYLCECAPGYIGRNCDIDIDECQNTTCYNNGTCVDQTPGWYCACESGYTGVQCMTDTNECESNPCLSNGTCIDLVNAYRCICTQDSTGDHCERWINHCSSSPCLHGGVCMNVYGGFECQCQASWHGDMCEIKYMNRTEVCTDLEYTECSCYINQLKYTYKSYRAVFGIIGVAFGFCSTLCVYCVSICLNSVKSHTNKLAPDQTVCRLEEEINEKSSNYGSETSAKFTENKDKLRTISKIRHHECFTDHTGFDFAKLYIEKYGKAPKCRHMKSAV